MADAEESGLGGAAAGRPDSAGRGTIKQARRHGPRWSAKTQHAPHLPRVTQLATSSDRRTRRHVNLFVCGCVAVGAARGSPRLPGSPELRGPPTTHFRTSTRAPLPSQ
eukprot:364100-Chlamydomonas_euryale.AAC.47